MMALHALLYAALRQTRPGQGSKPAGYSASDAVGAGQLACSLAGHGHLNTPAVCTCLIRRPTTAHQLAEIQQTANTYDAAAARARAHTNAGEAMACPNSSLGVEKPLIFRGTGGMSASSAALPTTRTTTSAKTKRPVSTTWWRSAICTRRLIIQTTATEIPSHGTWQRSLHGLVGLARLSTAQACPSSISVPACGPVPPRRTPACAQARQHACSTAARASALVDPAVQGVSPPRVSKRARLLLGMLVCPAWLWSLAGRREQVETSTSARARAV